MSPSEIVISLVRKPTTISLGLVERGLNGALTVTRIARELIEPRQAVEPEGIFGLADEPREEQLDEAVEEHVEEAIEESLEAAIEESPLAEPSVPLFAGDAEPLPAERATAPDPAAPEHVDEEPVLVAEVAEEGAEDGAGAELHVEEPWPDYDSMTAAEVRRRLESDGHALAAAVVLYEGVGRNRATVIEAAERKLR